MNIQTSILEDPICIQKTEVYCLRVTTHIYYREKRILLYHIFFIFKVLLADIQVSTLDLSSQVIVNDAIMLIQALRVFFDNLSVSAGIRKIATPTCFQLVPQPNIEQFAPGNVKKQ